MKKILVSLFALAMLSVGFAGDWEFFERHDAALDQDASFVKLQSDNLPSEGSIIIGCYGTDGIDVYVTTTRLYIYKTEQLPDGVTASYAQVAWRFNSQDETTDLLRVSMSGEAVYFVSEEQLSSFVGGLFDGGTLGVRVSDAGGNPVTYTFEVSDPSEALLNLKCVQE